MAEDKIYLSMASEKRQPENDGYVAVISQGQPKLGDDQATILTVKVVKDEEEAKAWYLRMMNERPWETRS